jgi:hypothetical protein
MYLHDTIFFLLYGLISKGMHSSFVTLLFILANLHLLLFGVPRVNSLCRGFHFAKDQVNYFLSSILEFFVASLAMLGRLSNTLVPCLPVYKKIVRVWASSFPDKPQEVSARVLRSILLPVPGSFDLRPSSEGGQV